MHKSFHWEFSTIHKRKIFIHTFSFVCLKYEKNKKKENESYQSSFAPRVFCIRVQNVCIKKNHSIHVFS